MNQRKHIAPEQKAIILREHLENHVPLSDLSEKYQVHPNILHRWKKELFEGAVDTFSRKHRKESQAEARRAERLTEKLRQKDKLIAELVQDNIESKRDRWRDLNTRWVKMDIRDSVVSYVQAMTQKSGICVTTLVVWVGISLSKYYTWVHRLGSVNNHNQREDNHDKNNS